MGSVDGLVGPIASMRESQRVKGLSSKLSPKEFR